MHVAAAVEYDVWIASNTAKCHRLDAWISEATCISNRAVSEGKFGDGRCTGCNGLHDQPKHEVRLRAVIPSVDNATVENAAQKEDQRPRDEENSAPVLVEELKPDGDPLTCALLAGLRSLLSDEEDDQPVKPPRGVRKKSHKRVQVFSGRCTRCNGYMVHGAKEAHDGIIDDDVYRCFNCGWRTSPGYSYNRNHPGEGKRWPSQK